MRRHTTAVLGALALVVLLASCAAGDNTLVGTAAPDGTDPVGFWWGLWHGLIAPVTFVISLFADGVGVYEVHNVGAWYDFGFLLGIAIALGGGPGASAARRR